MFASQAVLFAGVYAHLAIPAAVGILGVAFGLLLATPWVMRRSSTWGNRYALAVVTCTLWSLAGVAGGPTSPAMYWTAAIPIIAMMTESVRAGLVWVAVCSAMPAFAHGLEHAGVVFGNLSAHQDRTLGVPAVGMLCIVVLSSGLLYERALATAFERIERTSNSMRFLLDHVDQGLVAVAPDGRQAGMRSAALETWFGRARRGRGPWRQLLPAPPKAIVETTPR